MALKQQIATNPVPAAAGIDSHSVACRQRVHAVRGTLNPFGNRSRYPQSSSLLGAAEHPAVRVAIYSDEPILATGFKALIAADPTLKLSACCTTISQLKKQLASGIPDVAVVDFTEDVTAETLAELQHLAAHCKVILWTNSIEGDLALRALRFGVRGVLRKTLPLEAHRQCLHRVNSGDLWFERQMTNSVN